MPDGQFILLTLPKNVNWIPQQTLQPFSSSTAAIARPRPAAAPVTNATLPPGYFFCGSIPLISFFFLLSLPKVSGSSGNFSYSDVASSHYSTVVEWHTCTELRYLTYVLRNGAHRLSCVCVRGCVSRMAIFFLLITNCFFYFLFCWQTQQLVIASKPSQMFFLIWIPIWGKKLHQWRVTLIRGRDQAGSRRACDPDTGEAWRRSIVNPSEQNKSEDTKYSLRHHRQTCIYSETRVSGVETNHQGIRCKCRHKL